jgi:FkbM family methyltransferase
MSIKKSVRQFYKNIVFRLSAKNSVIFKFFYTYLYNPSKGSLAQFYNEYSKEKDQVFVIQVGANDGINHDPIHKFIKRDNWYGILIEPQPYVFRNLLHPLYRRDQNIALENIAISDQNQLMDMYRLSFCQERGATGLTTFDKEVLKSAVDSGRIDDIAKREGVDTPTSREAYIESFKAEAKSFAFLFEKYAVKHVDVLQIDAEGFDYEVIKLYDLTQNKPEVLVFEVDHLSNTEFKEVEEHLHSNSYKFVKIGRDVVAVNHNASKASRIFDSCFKS